MAGKLGGEMNNRRKFVIALGAGAPAAPFGSFAQHQPVRIRRIGILLATSASDPEWPRRIGALTEARRALGWAEGKNLAIELRHAEGKPEQLPALAAELVQANVDVIVTQGAQPINAARKATSIIPIVMAQSGNAVESGFVANLAHPGGNVTGLTLVSIEQVVKRLQLIKDFSP